jgi:translation elongation factor P/translation initiation factor 5A
MKNLRANADMEHYLMDYKRYDEYEASAQPGQNLSAMVKETFEAGVSDVIKKRIKINELSLKALGAR